MRQASENSHTRTHRRARFFFSSAFAAPTSCGSAGSTFASLSRWRPRCTRSGRDDGSNSRCSRAAKKKLVTLSLPIIPQLEEVLAQSPLGSMTFLDTEFGKPYTPNGFGSWFRRRCLEAKLEQYSAHGLRKAGATIAADNGASTRTLMAMYGWSSSKQAELYTRAKLLAGGGMILLADGQSANKTVPLQIEVSSGGTRRAKNREISNPRSRTAKWCQGRNHNGMNIRRHNWAFALIEKLRTRRRTRTVLACNGGRSAIPVSPTRQIGCT